MDGKKSAAVLKVSQKMTRGEKRKKLERKGKSWLHTRNPMRTDAAVAAELFSHTMNEDDGRRGTNVNEKPTSSM
jgi:hypothetical protein